ncbi:MAG: hypothetical protein OXG24_08210 [Gammaproteobacteria bacterium]|nr:hypothetical protein [Gammaproteobacteria bacterium]
MSFVCNYKHLRLVSDDDPNKLTEEEIEEDMEGDTEKLTDWIKATAHLPDQTGTSGNHTSDPEQDIDCKEEEE